MKIAGLLAALALGSTLVLPGTGTAAATTATCTWSPSALPMPAGASTFSVNGTDHSGGFAGSAYFSGDRRRVLAWKNGTVTDYGGVASTTAFISVVDENRAGTILLNTTDGYFGSIKLAYRIRAGVWEQLAPLPGASQPIAKSINDAGDVIGTNIVQRNGNVGTVVVRWPVNQTTPVEVPGLPLHATAIDLDQDGTLLVGLRNPETQGQIPHVLRGGVLTALPAPPKTNTPRAVAISNGRVIGGVSTRSGPNQGVHWDQAGTPQALPSATEGLLINRDGLIIGSHVHPDLSHGVWRGTTLEYAFGTFNDHVFTGTISDDGTFAGTLGSTPTSWRCA